jgi:valyl-tRNA synthetase
MYIPSGELSDPAEEIAKLTAEKERLESEIRRSTGILSNPGFLKKAPAAKVENEKQKLEAYQKQYAVIMDRLHVLKG